MNTRFKLLTWDIENDCIDSKEFEKENDAIQTAQALDYRYNCPHDIINIQKTKKTGHRWDIEVLDIDNPQKRKYISFYSKKDALFAIKSIKEYDDTLKTDIIQIY